ncbi:MAG: hypothetical protein ACP5R5_13725, partial [Armatimonadota bacterium]
QPILAEPVGVEPPALSAFHCRRDRLQLDTIRRQSKVLLMIHEGRDTINDGDFNWGTFDAPSNVHDDGTTVAYVDQHARYHSYKELTTAKSSRQWDPYK